MKKLLYVLFAVMGILCFSGCQQDDLAPEVSDADIIAKFNAIHGGDTPSDSLIFALYGQNKPGLKSADGEPAPKIGLMVPLNHLTVVNGKGIRQIWPWIIVENYGWAKDEGLIIANYDQDFNLIDYEFIIGWDNDYCSLVTIHLNVEYVETEFNFSFPVKGGGNLSYQQFSNGESKFKVWLPLFDYDVSWETWTEAGFAGLRTFNSAEENELYINVGSGIYTNTFDYIILNIDEIGIIPNSKIVVGILDEDGNHADRAELFFPYGRTFPSQIKIPLTFRPSEVYYYLVEYKNGMMDDNSPERIYKKCYLVQEYEGVRFWILE